MTSYGWSTVTMHLSGTVMAIWCLKDNGVTTLTFLGSRDVIGHVTIWHAVGDFLWVVHWGRLTLQGVEHAKKGKWKENCRFWQSVEVQGMENARKDKVASTRKRNCKEWNLEGNGIGKEQNLQVNHLTIKSYIFFTLLMCVIKCLKISKSKYLKKT